MPQRAFWSGGNCLMRGRTQVRGGRETFYMERLLYRRVRSGYRVVERGVSCSHKYVPSFGKAVPGWRRAHYKYPNSPYSRRS